MNYSFFYDCELTVELKVGYTGKDEDDDDGDNDNSEFLEKWNRFHVKLQVLAPNDVAEDFLTEDSRVRKFVRENWRELYTPHEEFVSPAPDVEAIGFVRIECEGFDLAEIYDIHRGEANDKYDSKVDLQLTNSDLRLLSKQDKSNQRYAQIIASLQGYDTDEPLLVLVNDKFTILPTAKKRTLESSPVPSPTKKAKTQQPSATQGDGDGDDDDNDDDE